MENLATDVTAEILRIEDSLARLKMQIMTAEGATRRHAPGNAAVDPAAAARLIYRMRRLRDEMLGGRHFGEPAWDILLDLYIAHADGKTVPVSTVCIGASVPTTTALRWVASMVDEGWIIRTPDPHDGRRAMLELSPDVADSDDEAARGDRARLGRRPVRCHDTLQCTETIRCAR